MVKFKAIGVSEGLAKAKGSRYQGRRSFGH